MRTITRPTLTLVDILAHLIKMPTLTEDHAANRAALDWIAGQLKGLPLTIKRFDNHGYPALIATTSAVTDEKNPRLWFAGHLDVVPGTIVDFEPKIIDGRLIGRGVFDMKYAIACFVRLFQELGANLASYNIGLMLTTDEELNGRYGVQWLLKDQGYRGQAVILPECGTSWTIETAAKGTTSWNISSRGLSSHASRPWNGVNAIDQLTRFIDHLRTNVPVEPCGDELHRHSTISLGVIQGGIVSNQVPDYAHALLDIRLIPGLSLEEVRTWFARAALAVPGVSGELVAGGGVASQNPLQGPAAIFAGIVRDVTDIEVRPMLSHGASDGRFFSEYHIPVITVPPTGGGQHSAYEWIDLKSLEDYYEITRRFTQVWAGPERYPQS